MSAELADGDTRGVAGEHRFRNLNCRDGGDVFKNLPFGDGKRVYPGPLESR